MLRRFLQLPPAWIEQRDRSSGPPQSYACSLPDYVPSPPNTPCNADTTDSIHGTHAATASDACEGSRGESVEQHAQTAVVKDIAWVVQQQSLSCDGLGSRLRLTDSDVLQSLCGRSPYLAHLLSASNAAEGQPLVANFLHESPRVTAGYKGDLLVTHPSALQHWCTAGLQPFAAPQTASYVIICPSELRSASWLGCRNISDIYHTCNLGSLISVDGKAGSIFTYDTHDNSDHKPQTGGCLWGASLQRTCLKLRRYLLDRRLQDRPMETGLNSLKTCVLTYLVLPEHTAAEAVAALRVAAQSLDGVEVVPQELQLKPCPSQSSQRKPVVNSNGEVTNASLYDGAATLTYQEVAECRPVATDTLKEEASQLPKITLQVLTPDCLADISGNTLHGLPFSIYRKLCESQSHAAVAPITTANPLCLVLSEVGSIKYEEDSKGSLHCCYIRCGRNSVALAWSSASGECLGCQIIHLPLASSCCHVQDLQRRSFSAAPPAASDAAEQSLAKRQRVAGPMSQSDEKEPNQEEEASLLVEHIFAACMKVCEHEGAAADSLSCLVISALHPMSCTEVLAWDAHLSTELMTEKKKVLGTVLICILELPNVSVNVSGAMPDLEQPVTAHISVSGSGPRAFARCSLTAERMPQPMRPELPNRSALLSFHVVASSAAPASKCSSASTNEAASRDQPSHFQLRLQLASKVAKELHSLVVLNCIHSGLEHGARQVWRGASGCNRVAAMAGIPAHAAVALRAAAFVLSLSDPLSCNP